MNQGYLDIDKTVEFSQMDTRQLYKKEAIVNGFYAEKKKQQIMLCIWRIAFILMSIEDINEKLGFLGEIKF